jgi:hypothetical protein
MRQVYTVSDKTKAKYLASCPDQGDRLEPAREINFSAHANCGKNVRRATAASNAIAHLAEQAICPTRLGKNW